VSVAPARVARMARKELRQMLRDLRMRSVIFAAPLIQLVMFGYAVSTDVHQVPVAVVDHDRTARSRELTDRLVATEYFRLAVRPAGSAGLVRALDRGEALVGIEIPPGFAQALASGRGATVQVLVDGTDSNTGNVALGYLQRIVRGITADLQVAQAPGPGLTARAWYNPALESRVYNVPAVVGALLLIITMLLTALSVVREREVGTWEQLVVSPISPAELMLGKTLPVALIGLVDLALVSAVAILWFGIPFRGAPATLLLAALPFLVAGLALGLLISTISATQQEAFMSMFLILLPALVLSGFMFPITSMPTPVRAVTLLNPLRHFLEVVRAVFLKGTTAADLWPQYLALYVMASAGLWLGVVRFRRMVG